MGEATPLTVVSDGAALVRTIKRRFGALTSERLLRVREQLKPDQRVVLDVLPLLFHINDPELPGFVSNTTPVGIANYSPPKRAIEAAGKLARKFSYGRRAMRMYQIQALYMIGSTGTIGYSEASDFDIWVCHHPDLTPAELDSLRAKGEAISRWAESLRLEVNFFVLDPGSFERGEAEDLSHDNSGSAQRQLLLEEFYRTGLLLAGRYPAWWLVPAQPGIDYRQHLRSLTEKGWVSDFEYLDFGDVSEIPPEEFFGAALWQLHKAVDSPYKSVLKLLLMEAYAAEYPNPDLLCVRFKRALYDEQPGIDDLDPYVLMAQKVEEYLAGRGELERLELARRCFYFKINQRLSERARPGSQARREVMEAIVGRWQWSHDQLLMMDSRGHWKIHRVIEERKALVDELMRSYQLVSDFARRHTRESSINSADLNVLGRRLYAAFERKAGKVEILNPGISRDLTERHLAFLESNEGGREAWFLYRGDENPGVGRKPAPLKTAQSLIELAAWCHFNRLIGPQTLVTLQNPNGSLSSRELLAVIDTFRRLWPDGELPETDMERFKQPAALISSALFINLGVDPLAAHSRQGMHLTSNRSDALSYGGFWKNLAISFDLLVLTSWHEVLTFRYKGDNALMDCLCDYLAWAPLSAGKAPPPVPVYSFSSARGMAIAHRIEELVRDITQVFYGPAGATTARYIVRVEYGHYLLQAENDRLRPRQLGSDQDLLLTLGEAQERFSPVVFDRYAVDGSALAQLMDYNRADVVQVFYQAQGGRADVYVLDEKGSLFTQVTEFHSHGSLMGQYRAFLEAAVRRCNVTEHSPFETNISTQVEFYQLRRDRGGRLVIDQPKNSVVAASDYFSIQVIGEGSQSAFKLYCDGQEFSSLEHGDEVYRQVARYVLSRRNTPERYPIYITDVDVSRALLKAEGADSLQTVHFLNYKKTVEQRLNAALREL